MDPSHAKPSLALSDLLTPRQIECMRMVERGLTSKQIAHQMGISYRTVEQHVAASLDALDANNRLAGVARMRELDASHKAVKREGAVSLIGDKGHGDYLVTDIAAIVPDEGEQYEKTEWPVIPPLGGSANNAPAHIRRAWIIRVAILSLMLTSFVFLSIVGVVAIAGGFD